MADTSAGRAGLRLVSKTHAKAIDDDLPLAGKPSDDDFTIVAPRIAFYDPNHEYYARKLERESQDAFVGIRNAVGVGLLLLILAAIVAGVWA